MRLNTIDRKINNQIFALIGPAEIPKSFIRKSVASLGSKKSIKSTKSKKRISFRNILDDNGDLVHSTQRSLKKKRSSTAKKASYSSSAKQNQV
jgi:hypothetical protein